MYMSARFPQIESGSVHTFVFIELEKLLLTCNTTADPDGDAVDDTVI